MAILQSLFAEHKNENGNKYKKSNPKRNKKLRNDSRKIRSIYSE